MATVKIECELLKVRIQKRESTRKITFIDQPGSTTSFVGTVMEGFQELKNRIEKGRESEVIHVVDHEEEKKRKLTPGKQTRLIVNFGTNESFRKAYAEQERIIEVVVDLSVARHIIGDTIIEALRSLTEEKLREMTGTDSTTQAHEKDATRPVGPPRAEIPQLPDWAK